MAYNLNVSCMPICSVNLLYFCYIIIKKRNPPLKRGETNVDDQKRAKFCLKLQNTIKHCIKQK